MIQRRKSYPREFKIETVKLVVAGKETVPQLAEDLGIHPNTIYKWVNKYSEKPADAFPGKGNLAPDAALLRELQRENERLRMERDILKKAVAIFSKEQQ